MDYDKTWKMRDSVALEPRVNDTESDDDVFVLDDTDQVDWSRVPTTTLDTHQSFFDTDEFYALNVTIAKPIEQRYTIDDDDYTLFKPADELSRAAWSVDNSPWTIEHPDGGNVSSVDEIRGVFRDTTYDWENESLQSTLHIPTNDRGARDYVDESDNVSIGFYNTLDADIDREGVTAAQRDIYIDHVASVTDGRCSDTDGCKVHMAQDSVVADSTTKIMTCDCNSGDNNMTDNDSDSDFPVKSLTVDAVREKNEYVDERIAELTEKLNDAQSASEKLASVRESVDSADDVSIVEAVESLQNDREELQDELKEYREGELDELRQSIVDGSDYELEEIEDMGKSDLELIADSLDKLSGGSDGSDDGDDGDDDPVNDSSEFGLDESSVKTPTNDTSGDGSDAPTADFNPLDV